MFAFVVIKLLKLVVFIINKVGNPRCGLVRRMPVQTLLLVVIQI